jgi:ankyrin repeat protein
MDSKNRELPARPSLDQYKKQAKDLVKAYKSGDSEAIQQVRKSHPHASKLLDSKILKAKLALADAQLIIAREHGFESWPKFARQIETLIEKSNRSFLDPLSAFIEAASVPLDAHSSGTLERAETIRAAHPEIAASDIYPAAILGDDAAVRRFLAIDSRNATAKGGPRGWDALTYLCFSRYLRHDRTRASGSLRAATTLLDAGASANTGFYEKNHQPEPGFESVLYAAAGIAHDAEMTRLLLSRGADANNIEVVYHAPETYDNAALKVLVESGKLNPDSLAIMLLRKHDLHDYEGIKWLLEHDADPNRMTRWGRTSFHHAVLRDNAMEIIEALLDHGANPLLVTKTDGKSAVAIAARRGRGGLIELFARRGFSIELQGVERLIATCATNEVEKIRAIAASEPELVRQLRAEGGKLLAGFAGVGNTEGVRHLLDLGVDIAARFKDIDAYWDLAKDTTALHVAAWRARHATVKLLLERKAPVDVPDGKGRTPLAFAVRACVDSYWTNLRSPESVQALLEAGASVANVDFPSGYAELDELLRRYADRG